jgi:hypothetical protein
MSRRSTPEPTVHQPHIFSKGTNVLKKNITYRTLDGVQATKEFHFNLTKAELIELEMTEDGGLRDQLEKLSVEKDRAKIMAFIRHFIAISVGERVGDAFIKNDAIRDAFMGSDAYSELFVEMLLNPGEQARFIAGLMPQELVAQVDVEGITRKAFTDAGLEYKPENWQKNAKGPRAYDASIDEVNPEPSVTKVLADYTDVELLEMPIAQFHGLLEANKGKLSKPHILLAMQRANES